MPQSSRYEIRDFLGAGGMAQVYRAWDSVLERHVALKILRNSDAQYRKRAQREAQTQARVSHPAVCKVFDAGDLDGKPYVAMELISGPTLADLAPKLSLSERLQALAIIAEGVHAAHEVGLVHRDLKPGNILMHRDEGATESGAAWSPVIVDFGLAREVSSAAETAVRGNGNQALTEAGAVLGTAAYMAPEQARGSGNAIDARTDVYALGAMLYDLAAGRPPFEGESSVDVLLKVVSEEPVSLRKVAPETPQALEVIAGKCLAKDPAGRYASAREVADELKRFLEHRPIQAKPPSIKQRLQLWIRRHRALALVSGVLGVAIIVLGSAWLAERLESNQRRTLALRFGTEAARLGSQMRVARMAPAHDIGLDRRRVELQVENLEERIRQAGRAAVAPGDYALGLAHLGLRDLESAERRLKSAYDAGLRGAEVRVAYAEALLRRFGEEVSAVYLLSTRLREARLQELADRYRDPAKELLGGVGPEGFGSDVAPRDGYIQALEAFADGDSEALKVAVERALEADGSRFELLELQGSAEHLLGLQADLDGDEDTAVRQFTRARDAFARAGLIARSNAEAFVSACVAEESLLDIALRSGQMPPESVSSFCDQAMKLDPNESLPKVVHGVFLQRAAVSAYRRSAPFEPLLRKSQAFLEDAYASSTGVDRGRAASALAIQLLIENDLTAWHQSGDGPAPERAVALAREAYELNPSAATGTALGQTLRSAAGRAGDRGVDPAPIVKEASAVLAEVLERSPKYSLALTTKATILDEHAQYSIEHGSGDPQGLWAEARELFERALRLDPQNSTTALNLGISFMIEADALWYRGDDPREAVAAGDAFFEHAVEVSPERASLHYNRATLWSIAAEHALRSAPDDAEALVAQVAESHSLAYKTDAVEYGCSEGRTEWLNARWQAQRSQSPQPNLDRGRQLIDTVLEKFPESWRCLRDRARLGLEEARWHSRGESDLNLGGSPVVRKLLEGARADALSALEASSDEEDVFWVLAEIESLLARQSSNREARLATAQRALAAYHRQSEIRPGRWNSAARIAQVRALLDD